MVRSLGFLHGAGALLVALSLALPHDHNPDEHVLWIPVGIAAAVAAVLYRLAERIPYSALPWFVACGTALISACVAFGGHAAGAYGLMYVWIALYAGSFFSPLDAALQSAGCAVAFAVIALLTDSLDEPEVHWLMTSGTIFVAAIFITRLAAVARSRVQDLAVVADVGSVADVNEFAAAVCQGLRRSSAADVVVLLEPLPEGRGLQVTGMSGTSEAGLVLNAPAALDGIERAFRSGEAQVLENGGDPGLLRGRQLGLAQPVRRDGETIGVLALAWTRPRRRITDRVATAAVLFAAEASVALERREQLTLERERHALEINDNIVQGLVVAKYAAASGNTDQALQAIDDTLSRARRLITAQLDDVRGGTGDVRPGDLVRREASEL